MNIDWEKVFYVVLGGIISLGGKYIIDYFINKHKSRIIDDNQSNKIINVHTLKKLMPGKSIANMKDLLGQPLVYNEGDFDLTEWSNELNESKEIRTSSLAGRKELKVYIYRFSNADIKITTYDDKVVNSLTIVPFLNKKVDISDIALDKLIINKSKFNFDTHIFDFVYTTAKDFVGMVKVPLGNPLYKYFTFFFYNYEEMKVYLETKNVEDLKGATINGVCITESSNEEIYYIFDSEILF